MELNDLLKKLKEPSRRKYDVAVAFSGGKDSTYLIHQLKYQRELEVVAITVNHPFLNKETLKTSKKVVGKLKVDQVVIDIDPELFLNFISLGLREWENLNLSELAGCQLCGLFHRLAVRNISAKMNVPLILWGHDPSQVLGEPELAWDFPLRDLFENLVGNIKDSIYSPGNKDTPPEYNYYAEVGYNHRTIRHYLAEYGLLNYEKSDPVQSNCQIFHYFAKKALEITGKFPYQDMVDYALRNNISSIWDQVLGTDTNLTAQETSDVLRDYRRILLQGEGKELLSGDIYQSIQEGLKLGTQLFEGGENG